MCKIQLSAYRLASPGEQGKVGFPRTGNRDQVHVSVCFTSHNCACTVNIAVPYNDLHILSDGRLR